MSRQTAVQPQPTAITGIQAMQGQGAPAAKGFWSDAWAYVLRRRGAVLGLVWISIVAFFAVFSPVLANGHPLVLRELDASGQTLRTTYPLLRHLTSGDVLLLLGGILGPLWLLAPLPIKRADRATLLFIATIQAGLTVVVAQALVAYVTQRDVSDFVRTLRDAPGFWPMAPIAVAAVCALPFLLLPVVPGLLRRLATALPVAVVAGVAVAVWWSPPLTSFNYLEREIQGRVDATYTLIPWSPLQSDTRMHVKEPGATVGDILAAEEVPADVAGRRFHLGTDALGQDVLSHMLHACRLSISIGLVSTSIAVVIGVTIGALMGYFGGWVDLLLYRVVEIFMAVPVLFLLIVAVAVLPRNTYVMMAIIGCFTWTSAARFIRAEFLKLRNQDFVQSAKAVGLPLRSILFKHMLPNGVTPVLVDSSFLIAAAILAEATLSYLGLGPEGQASWGKLLSNATGTVGDFVWWLAIFPGFAIFLTVLSYNLIGEALRDAIDPKLKKARV